MKNKSLRETKIKFSKLESTIINSFDYRIPDGYPLTWPLNISSEQKYNRLAGADIFDYLVENDTQLRHFFLGDTEEVLKMMEKNLSEKYLLAPNKNPRLMQKT